MAVENIVCDMAIISCINNMDGIKSDPATKYSLKHMELLHDRKTMDISSAYPCVISSPGYLMMTVAAKPIAILETCEKFVKPEDFISFVFVFIMNHHNISMFYM